MSEEPYAKVTIIIEQGELRKTVTIPKAKEVEVEVRNMADLVSWGDIPIVPVGELSNLKVNFSATGTPDDDGAIFTMTQTATKAEGNAHHG